MPDAPTLTAAQIENRLTYVIHEAVCTAYEHQGRNALCERAAKAVHGSELVAGWLVEARAEGWDEGLRAGRRVNPRNPYRSTP